MTGKVARMTDFGAFVELEDACGCSSARFFRLQKNTSTSHGMCSSIGQEITAKAVDFDGEAKKISLSVKVSAGRSGAARRKKRQQKNNILTAMTTGKAGGRQTGTVSIKQTVPRDKFLVSRDCFT